MGSLTGAIYHTSHATICRPSLPCPADKASWQGNRCMGSVDCPVADQPRVPTDAQWQRQCDAQTGRHTREEGKGMRGKECNRSKWGVRLCCTHAVARLATAGGPPPGSTRRFASVWMTHQHLASTRQLAGELSPAPMVVGLVGMMSITEGVRITDTRLWPRDPRSPAKLRPP